MFSASWSPGELIGNNNLEKKTPRYQIRFLNTLKVRRAPPYFLNLVTLEDWGEELFAERVGFNVEKMGKGEGEGKKKNYFSPTPAPTPPLHQPSTG